MGKLIKGLSLLVIVGLGLTGCFLPGAKYADSPEELAKMASSVVDLKNLQQVSSGGRLEVEDLEETGEPVQAKALFVKEWRRVLPDGTVVTWTHILDDRDTPEDPEDDLVTVTREYDVWNGEVEKTEKIVRPRKPEADWTSWENDRIVQVGTVEIFADGILIQRGEIRATWMRHGDCVAVSEMLKEVYRPDRTGAIERIVIMVDADGLQLKTKYRIRLTRDGEVVVHSFTYEEFIEDGVVTIKITREDGWYSIVRNPRDPRITEHYDPDDCMVARVTETRDGQVLDVVKEFYDGCGNLIALRHVTIHYRFLGDQVVVTRIFDNGQTHTTTITEDGEGYVINRNGYVYRVRFIANGVDFLDDQGNLIATVVFNSDGTYTVTKAGEVQAHVAL